MKTPLQKVALVLVYVLAIVFSIKNMLEPDLWWQLRTGEWMLETGSIPTTDPFSFTFYGTPWQNIKWGFELIIALLSKTLGLEMVMLVQVLCSIGIVYFLGRLIRILAPTSVHPLVYLTVGLSFLVLEYRMSGRPEAITHVFFLALITLLLEFRMKPSRLVWCIPIMMMAWANLHEAFGIGLVVLVVFMVVAWLEVKYTQTQTKQQAMQLMAVFGLSVVVICVNPNGTDILFKPFEIAQQLYVNKYTTELVNYTQPLYWTKEAWVTMGMLVFVLIGVLLRFKQTKIVKGWKRLNEVMPLPLGILLVLLVYLASGANRNIIFATLLGIPLLVQQLLWVVLRVKLRETVWYGITVGVLLIVYVSVVSNTYYTFTQSKNRFGLEVPTHATPVGAANFIAQNNLPAKPVFSDYLTSSYLLWRLQPTFKTFIDLRDLDVFSQSHFELFGRIISDPAMFEKSDSQYHYGAVVLLREPQLQTLHSYLYNHPVYRLAYMDAISCVYVKDSSFTRFASYHPLATFPTTSTASVVNHLFNPWFHSNDLQGIDEAMAAGEYYYDVGNMELAAIYASQQVSKGVDEYKGLELLGQITYHKFLEDTSANKHRWSDSASFYFNKAYKLNPEYVPLLIDLGVKTFNDQQYKSAVNYLKKACELDPDNLKAQRNMAEVYKTQALANGDQKTLQLSIDHFNRANELNPHNPEIMMNLGFLYFRLGDCDNAVKYLEQIVDYTGITELQRSRAKECITKCR